MGVRKGGDGVMGRQLMLRREMMAKIAPRQKVQKYIELKNTMTMGQPDSGTLDCAALGLEIGDEITVIAIGGGQSVYNTHHDMKGGRGNTDAKGGGGGGGGDAGNGYGGGYGGDGGSGGANGQDGGTGYKGGNAGEAVVVTVNIEELNIPYTLGGRILIGGNISNTTFGAQGKYAIAKTAFVNSAKNNSGGAKGTSGTNWGGGGGGGGGMGAEGWEIDYNTKQPQRITPANAINGENGQNGSFSLAGKGGKGAINNAGGAAGKTGTDGKAGDKESKSIIVVFYMGYED